MKQKRTVVKLLVFAVVTAALIGVLAAAGQLRAAPGEGLRLNWGSLGRIALMLFATLLAENLIVLLLSLFRPQGHRARTLLTLTANMVKYAAAVVILCGVLALLSVDITAILAGLGIIALIIGFGAESLIADVVTGLFILVDNQYNVGDIIEVGGFRGTVSEIGIRTTCITDVGGNVKIINNSEMKSILNRSDNSSRAVADFAIPYATDLAALETKLPGLLEEIYRAHPDMLKAVPAYLGVQELASSSVVLRFVAEVGEADIYSGARVLNHDLLLGFRALGVECPFPQVDVHGD